MRTDARPDLDASAEHLVAVLLPWSTHVNHSLLRIDLQVPDLEAFIEHAGVVLGMEAVEREPRSASLALPGQPVSVSLTQGDAPALTGIAFATDTENLDEVRDRARRYGTDCRSGDAGVRLLTPNGLAIELLAVAQPHGNTTERTAGPLISGLDHVSLCAKDLDATVAFFCDVLGFRLSDSVENKRHWLRCGPSHHHVAVFEGDNALQHYAFLTSGFDQIQRLGDLLATRGQNFVWGPGRHALGANIFSYHIDPAGAVLEVCSDMIQIPDEEAWVTQVWPADTLASAIMWGPPPPAEFRELSIPVVDLSKEAA